MAKMFPPPGGGMDKMLGGMEPDGDETGGMGAPEEGRSVKKPSKGFGKPVAKKSMRGFGKKSARI